MKKIILRVACFMITLICLLSAFPVVSSASYDIDSTYVMDDLEKLSDFNIEEYTKNENDEYVSLIAFHEYGYDYNKNFSDYGLFVYLYNPSGKAIMNASETEIYMKVGNSYKRYILIPVSYSVESGYEHVFYKFKVQITSDFIKSLSPSKRIYDINGFSIYYREDGESKRFDNKYLFYYTGYDAYHGTDRTDAASTLYCSESIEESVSLELHPAYYITETSDKGINHHYQISSVYFAIPNYILERYKSEENLYYGLWGVTTEWYEYKTNALITNNTNLWGDALNHVDYSDKDLSSADSNIPFQFHVWHDESDPNGDRCSFNYNNKLSDVYCPWFVGASSVCGIPKFNNVIFKNYEEFDGLTDAEMASSILKSDNTVNSFSFVDDGRIRGYNKQYFSIKNGALNEQIKNYSATHKDTFWTFLNSLFTGTDNPNDDPGISTVIDPFYKVTSSDFEGTDVEANANKLFISPENYTSLKSFYEDCASDGYTVFILRFAVTDYVLGEAFVESTDGKNIDYGSDNYYLEATVFLNFNFITMSFGDEKNGIVTLPVESSPINIIPGASDSFNPNDSDGGDDTLSRVFSYLTIIFVVIALAAVAFVVFKFWDRISIAAQNVSKEIKDRNKRR